MILLPEMDELTSVNTAQKMTFSIKDFFSKCDQIHRKLRICSHLLKKSLMENFIFCAVKAISVDEGPDVPKGTVSSWVERPQ